MINTQLDPANLTIRSILNGRVCQDGNTNMMMRDPYDLVAFASSVMTLEPGDVVTLGTPEGVGPMQAGDIIEIEIQGIGVLRNSVRDEA